MVRTLKSYCNNKYKDYLDINYGNTKAYLISILKRCNEDAALALVAQSYYYSKDDFKTAKKFQKYTNESYNNKKDFLASENKYVDQFNKRNEAIIKNKNYLKKKIKSKMDKEDLSYYQINKKFGYSRSKLNDFFKYDKQNVFSIDKLIEIYKKLESIK